MAKRYVHTCVRVLDPDKSVAFYEALGYERRGKLQFETAYNIYMGLPGRRRHARADGQHRPHRALRPRRRLQPHRAARSTTSTRLLAELSKIGVEPEKPPFAPGGRDEVGRICFVADPDGYRIELIDGGEFKTPRTPERNVTDVQTDRAGASPIARAAAPADPSRLPPGQYETRDFPVLAVGPTPPHAAVDWSFTVRGAVAREVAWTGTSCWRCRARR